MHKSDLHKSSERYPGWTAPGTPKSVYDLFSVIRASRLEVKRGSLPVFGITEEVIQGELLEDWRLRREDISPAKTEPMA
jgi:hypothetical protein